MNDEFKILFEKIKDTKHDIENVLNYINNKTEILTSMYNEYLKQINNTTNYRISLDTFKFQTKLINIEHYNYVKMLKIFLNRMYGDYYKLHKKLIEYVKTDVKNVKIITNNEYPKYKDLDITAEYSFDTTDNLFSEILSIILELSNYCLKEHYLIKEIEKKQNNGININNFLNEKKYSIIILEQKINFYNDIISGYLSFQQKFFKRLYLKLKLIYAQINNDINLETSVSKSDNKLTKNTSFSNISSNLLENNIEHELDKHLSSHDNLLRLTPEPPSFDKAESKHNNNNNNNNNGNNYKTLNCDSGEYIENKDIENKDIESDSDCDSIESGEYIKFF